MSVKKFKFVSPGVFLNEIDNSQLPKTPNAVGPTIVGRLEKGPGMIPLTVESMAQFIDVFGNPVPGGKGGDVWRDGNYTAPTYAAYSAQAFLRNSGPVNVVRLLGVQDPNATAAGAAGWTLDGGTKSGNNPADPAKSSAYGLYLFSTGGVDRRDAWYAGGKNTNAAITKTSLTGTLAAVWYFQQGAINLSGNLGRLSSTQGDNATVSGSAAFGELTDSITVQVANGTTASGMTEGEKITITDASGTAIKYIIVDDDKSTVTTGTALNVGDSIGTGAATEAGVAVTIDLTGTPVNQNTFLVQLKTAIESTAGHNGTVTVSAVPGAAAAPQSITLTMDGQVLDANRPSTNISQLTIPAQFTTSTQILDGARTQLVGSHALVNTTNSNTMEFVAHLFDSGNTTATRVVFNFDRNSDKYIRKVFNTNPTLTNADVTQTTGLKKYWLGETFDRFIKDMHGQGTENGATNVLHKGALGGNASLSAVVVPLLKGSTPQYDHHESAKDSVTGWAFSQDITSETGAFDAANMQKLFKFIGIADGGSHGKELKISITDLKAGTDTNPYGTFTVLIRDVKDNDGRPVVLERFSQCNLNPNSKNYIGAKIGDQYREWDEADKRYRIYGNHPNQSKFFRVKIDQDVDAGVTDAQYLPFGFEGPIRYLNTTLIANPDRVDSDTGFSAKITGSSDPLIYRADNTLSYQAKGDISKHFMFGLPTGATASLSYPTLPLRLTASSEGLSNAKDSFFGVSTYRSPTDARFDPSYIDVVRRLGSAFVSDTESNPVTDKSEISFRFTLDDLIAVHKTGSVKQGLGRSQPHLGATDIGTAVYAAGARRAGVSHTAGRNGYTDLIKSGFAKFTMPVFGGFDGFDVTEKEPFRNSKMSGNDETTSYEIASLKRAIDSVSDPEEIEMNALTLPGITNARVTNQAIRVCEERADTLAIIDIENGGYIPSTENKFDFKTNVQNSKVTTAVTGLESRGLNSSYACCFYPWVKIVDQISDSQVWVPPSVAALGTFGSTERESELWFAPAGFTRGGLSDGAAGIPVIAVSQRLSSKERDELYEANINPIAQFPAEGIVVFGQKTLQVTPSALDRINVRRLMIFVKKEISRIAARLLFDQNVQATWDRFRGQVEPFLDSVKSRFGLSDFRVILDDTTTTPDLIDRNIMYAKIFLKPARAIEFIAIDFVITNTGASFED